MRALDRLVAILDAVVGSEEPATPAVIARGVDLPLPTVSRIMRELAQTRLLEIDDRTNVYSVGPRILELGYAARPSKMVNSIVPEMEWLRDRTGETVSLHVRSDGKRVCVCEVPSLNSVRRVVPVGLIVPLHFGATGIVLLASFAPDAIAAYAADHRMDEKATQALFRRVGKARSQGWAMAADSWVNGLSGLAAPVSDGEQVVASLVVSGPSSRWTIPKMTRNVSNILRAARNATQRLSGRSVGALSQTLA